ncbi:MAG TPA: 1-deoxy-D-xylulose-5-phosphate synthase [Candidatus Latescibacteria bacterium]|nr:1-deoxy-D-xylulose-5-phosphate synthase [Candidatus Latescibacterota bacterium]
MPGLLETIDSPLDLRRLPEDQLPELAREIRSLILDVISRNSGHFASSLGVVELTLALHRVFNTPRDKIIWDVGHQAYVHKIITGRREQFHTIRKKGGLSGYPRREESPYDVFGVGHASTSISAALGLATGRDLRGEDFHVVAVIGDGSMTGGMAWEAINNAGASGRDMLIVLNDNRMSISPNVGALARYFNEIITHETYNKLKADVWDFLGKIPNMGEKVRVGISQLEKAVKSLLVPGIVFEKLGIRYFGPVNGQDVHALIETLEQIKDLKGPRLLHVYTQKGKGVPFAENDPYKWHAGGQFDPRNGEALKKSSPVSYTDVFGKTLTKLCDSHPNVVGITAAMASGCGLKHLADKYPCRFFDVGIAEQHAVTFAGGLALEGTKPVVAIYSTFLQRAYDQIVHDIALQRLPVAFVLDRGGLVGDDGATHNGVFDLSYLRHIPNMVIMAPKDELEMQRMVLTLVEYNEGPIAMRYPRGCGPGAAIVEEPEALEPIGIGTWEVLAPGTEMVVLAIGSMVYPALEAAQTLREEGMLIEVVNARFAKPLDDGMMEELVRRHRVWVTVEENVLAGGFGSGVMEALECRGLLSSVSLSRLGIHDRFSDHGTREEVLHDEGLDAVSLSEAFRVIRARTLEMKVG